MDNQVTNLQKALSPRLSDMEGWSSKPNPAASSSGTAMLRLEWLRLSGPIVTSGIRA